MSLRSRILASIVVVIVLTVLITVGVGYYTTEARLGVFVDQIGDDEAIQLARNLSREYTAAGGWETVDRPLSEAGYIYAERPREERSDDGDEGHFEFFHQDPVRVVIAGLDGRVVTDNLFQLPPERSHPNWTGTERQCSICPRTSPSATCMSMSTMSCCPASRTGFSTRSSPSP